VQQEKRQQRQLTATPDRQTLLAVYDFYWPKNPKTAQPHNSPVNATLPSRPRVNTPRVRTDGESA
jgi:hypothetical protein